MAYEAGLTDRQEECIEALNEAADKVGDSPTVREYGQLDITPSQTTIKEAFGTWNTAKQAAGLEIRSIEGQTTVSINEKYFETIDSETKAYWLGCLFCHSARAGENNKGRFLQLGRSVEKRHYVESFADAVDSDYAINQYETADSDQVTTNISNKTFIDTLEQYGLDRSARNVEEYPDIPDAYEPAFMRAVLENLGNVDSKSGGWSIRERSMKRAERVQSWADSLGVKRSNISQKNNGIVMVYISNEFDAATVFEAAWPDGLSTTPTHTETAKMYATRIAEGHHYPENLSFTPIGDESGNEDTDSGTDAEGIETGSSQADSNSQTPIPFTVAKSAHESAGATTEVTVSVAGDVAFLIDAVAKSLDREPSAVVTEALRNCFADLLSGDTVQGGQDSETVVERAYIFPKELISIIETAPEEVSTGTAIEKALRHICTAESASITVDLPDYIGEKVEDDTDTVVGALSKSLDHG
jgi:hypothetical protein